MKSGHKIVRYRAGFQQKVDAKTAYEACSKIIGACTKGDNYCQAVVNAARDEKSVLHPEFEWDDEVAAEAHRRAQAAKLLRSFEIIYDNHVPARAFESFEVTFDDQPAAAARGRVYLAIDDAMADPSARQQLLERAMSEFRSARQRYAYMEELARIFAAIDDLDQDAASQASGG